MKLQKASRKRAKIKMAIQGPSGSGKTFSALQLAFGITGNWEKVAVIDSENGSANLYSHLGNYSVLNLPAPYSPERYIEAITICEQNNIEVLIIDSLSHEWEGQGGILDIHSSMVGNSFTNWSKLTPRHNALVNKILSSDVHIISTIRSKQDYVLSEKSNGKFVPEKVGLKGITREGFDYEFTIVLEIDIKHLTKASKDRTGLFMDKPEFKITTKTGQKILAWCNNEINITKCRELITQCKSINDLTTLYRNTTGLQKELEADFINQKLIIESLTSNTYKQNGNANK